jgi:hypothetical protein
VKGPLTSEECDEILVLLRIELTRWEHLIDTWGDIDGLRQDIEAYEWLAGHPDAMV